MMSPYPLMLCSTTFKKFKRRAESINITPNRIIRVLITASNTKLVDFTPMSWYQQVWLNVRVLFRIKQQGYVFIFNLEDEELTSLKDWEKIHGVKVGEMILQLIAAFNDRRVFLLINQSEHHFSHLLKK